MANDSSNSSRSTYRNYPHIASIESFLVGIEPLQPALVILFGSVATGDFTQKSDADILVIFDEPTEWSKVYAHSDGWVQPVVKTLAEVSDLLMTATPFFCEIIEDGIVLRDRDGFYDYLRNLVEEAKTQHGLVRSAEGWRWTPRYEDTAKTRQP